MLLTYEKKHCNRPEAIADSYQIKRYACWVPKREVLAELCHSCRAESRPKATQASQDGPPWYNMLSVRVPHETRAELGRTFTSEPT